MKKTPLTFHFARTLLYSLQTILVQANVEGNPWVSSCAQSQEINAIYENKTLKNPQNSQIYFRSGFVIQRRHLSSFVKLVATVVEEMSLFSEKFETWLDVTGSFQGLAFQWEKQWIACVKRAQGLAPAGPPLAWRTSCSTE